MADTPPIDRGHIDRETLSASRYSEQQAVTVPVEGAPERQPHGGNGVPLGPGAPGSDPTEAAQKTGTAAIEYRRALFNNQHDAIFVHDLSGRVIDVNEKMLEIYRLSREEAIGLYIVSDYSSPDNPPLLAHQQVLWKRVMSGQGQLFEWKARRPGDGSIFDVEVSLTKLSLPEGDFILATTRDITERKRVERELVATKNYLNTVFNNIHDAVFLHDVDGHVIDVNDKLLEMYRFTREEAIGLSIIPDYAIQDGCVDQRALWKRAIAGENQFFECRGRRPKDGYEFDAEIFLTRLSLPEGEFILANVRDITERKTMEKRMRERNLMLEVLNDIMASVGRSLRLSEILETLKRIFAEKLKIHSGAIFLYSEAKSKTDMAMCWGVPDHLRDAFEAFALGCYGAGKIIHEDDVTLLRNAMGRLDPRITDKFRRYRWYGYLCISLLIEGEMQGMIFLVDRKRESFSDDRVAFYKTLGQQVGVATQNARLFEQVRESHGQMKALSLRLVEVQEAERRYVARELHDEIGQELTGLKLALEMIALRKGEKSDAGLAQAQSLVNRLMGLVRELSLKLRPAMLDDLGLLPTLLWHFERFTRQTGIQVALRQKGIDGIRFPLQIETAIYRIVQEALTNVARHAKVNEVVVRLWADDRIAGAQIEDSGAGFSVESGFDRRQTNGLDGMRERAMLLGGHLTIESQPGVGTRLTAELPIDLGGREP